MKKLHNPISELANWRIGELANWRIEQPVAEILGSLMNGQEGLQTVHTLSETAFVGGIEHENSLIR